MFIYHVNITTVLNLTQLDSKGDFQSNNFCNNILNFQHFDFHFHFTPYVGKLLYAMMEKIPAREIIQA